MPKRVLPKRQKGESARPRKANAALRRQLAARNRDLAESRKQKAAMAEILRVISSSPNDALPVFKTIVRSAVALCRCLFANVFVFDGEQLHYAASHSTGPDYERLLRAKYPMRPDTSQVSGRVLLSRSVVRLENVMADPEYDQRFPTAMGWNWRMLGVPMLRDGRPLGAVVVGWAEAGPIAKSQEELLKTFAEQAVIALENVRQFEEIQEKSRQLDLANTYKTRFLTAASHDLRQPLHALNLYVGQLHRASEPAERGRLVAQIDATLSAINELFNALLDMSKLEAGILESNPTEFPINQLLQRVETTFAESAREKGLRLRVVPSSAWTRSDFILLERILFNLVSNAVRYTSRRGVVVGCRRRRKTLRLEVWDSGPGIPSDLRQHVFDEFYRLATPESDAPSGLGLGLAIVERLCRLLDHSIELSSRVGHGSRFAVTIPQVAARARTADAAVLSGVLGDPAPGKVVVVIDDDALALDSMRGLLQSWACTVVSALTEREALARLAALGRAPDLIISDYRLADGKRGIEAIELLRGTLGAQVPAFLISGESDPERLRDVRASGYFLLHKPVPPMALRNALNRFLGTRNPSAKNVVGEAPPS